MSELLLETRQLHKSFGGLHVTRDVNLRLQAGDKVGLIGPNGAGKTTLINLITGVLTPSAGSVRLAGEDVSALSQAQRVKRGLVRTFQITQLAPTLPVRLQVSEIAIVIVASLAVSLIATVIPARSAGRLEPLEGLRHG